MNLRAYINKLFCCSFHRPVPCSVVVPVMSKKTTKNTKDFRQYVIGDHVLGKVRGYPPWPGMVSEIVASIEPCPKLHLFFLVKHSGC